MEPITPESGQIYVIKHTSGLIRARFVGTREIGWKRKMTHYLFENLVTGRQIEIKSRAKIRRREEMEK